MTGSLTGSPIVDGAACGPLLRLERPISLWGGVHPRTGCITDPRHPQCGMSLTGAVVTLERLIGSSSSSSILLELIASERAPAALILGEMDAIAALGAIVAGELGYVPPPILQLEPSLFPQLPVNCRITAGGQILAL